MEKYTLELDDSFGKNKEVWRLVPISAIEERKRQDCSARPAYAATIYSKELAVEIAKFLNREDNSFGEIVQLKSKNIEIMRKNDELEDGYEELKAECIRQRKIIDSKCEEILRVKKENILFQDGLRAIIDSCDNCTNASDLRDIAKKTLEGKNFSGAKSCDSCAFEDIQKKLKAKEEENNALRIENANLKETLGAPDDSYVFMTVERYREIGMKTSKAEEIISVCREKLNNLGFCGSEFHDDLVMQVEWACDRIQGHVTILQKYKERLQKSQEENEDLSKLCNKAIEKENRIKTFLETYMKGINDILIKFNANLRLANDYLREDNEKLKMSFNPSRPKEQEDKKSIKSRPSNLCVGDLICEMTSDLEEKLEFYRKEEEKIKNE